MGASMTRILNDFVSSEIHDAEPPRILVVDDEEGVRYFIARVLGNAGYRVEKVASGADALAAVDRGEKFDLIVSDVRMPDLSGPHFIEQLRSKEPDVKVLYVTGYPDQLFGERETLWLDEAFLDKPFTARGILESVALLLFGRLAPPGPGRNFGAPRY
jgi:two-component system, cell cycle sensor histidine kinase and response regulator CckA